MDMSAIIQSLRDRGRRMASLNTPKDADLGDTALDIGAGFLPGVGSALSARDFERARREGDYLGMGLGAAGMIPVMGGASRAVSKALRKAPQDEALETARKNAVKMLGLPESNTAMDRARALGFVDRDFYHSTTKDFPAFDLAKSGESTTIQKTQPAVFVTDKPTVANEFVAGPYFNDGSGNVVRSYAERANTIPIRLRLDNSGAVVHDFAGGMYDESYVNQALKEAKKSKTSVVQFKDMRDPGFSTLGRPEKSNVVAVRDPSLLRSRFAAFDPARVNENDLLGNADPRLLALIAGGTLTGMTVNALRNKRNEEKEKSKEKEEQ